MAKKHLVFLMLMMMAMATASASTWKIHNYYSTSQIQNVFDTGDKIYYLNSDRLFQFDIGGAHDPNIHRNDALPANPFDHMVFQHPQKLDLNGLGHIAHLVQKKRATIGTLKTAAMGCQGAGKSALFLKIHILGAEPDSRAFYGLPNRNNVYGGNAKYHIAF